VTDSEQNSTLLDDEVFENINEYCNTGEVSEIDTTADIEVESEDDTDQELENLPYLNEADEERRIRLDISPLILN
jgi:hypothetical protein